MTQVNPNVYRSIRIGLRISLLLVLGLQPYPSAAQWTPEPVGYIRTLEGTVRIESAGRMRDAEPFGSVFASDRIVVEKGTAVVCDVRTGQAFDIRPGKPFSLPPSVAHPNAGLRERLLTALQALSKEPEQTGTAMVRAVGARELRPSETAFAPGVYVSFRWNGDGRSAQFSLYRMAAGRELVFHTESTDAHLSWPSDVAPLAGRYQWEAHDKNGTILGSGTFLLMTGEEAAQQRERYRAQASDEFGPENRELMAELLAARDGYFLK